MRELSADDRMDALADLIRSAAGARLQAVATSGERSAEYRSARAVTVTPVDAHSSVATLEKRPDPVEVPAVEQTSSPFDSVFEAVSGAVTWKPDRPLPPASRFMLPVATVGRPHRSTKRNYDYFEDLNRALAARRAEEQRNQG
jgi:hypothetical protein